MNIAHLDTHDIIDFDDFYVIAKYDSDIERLMPNGENTDYVEGYACEVFKKIDTEHTSPADYFTLGFGYEISDISDEQLLEGIKSHMGLSRTMADAMREKYHVTAMDEDFADALAKDIQAALYKIEQKYGVKLTCGFSGHPSGFKLFNTVGLDLIATMTYEGCDDPERERFALNCVNYALDKQYGLDGSAYGKNFVCDGRVIRIVDFKQTVANFITVDCEGSLYQLSPVSVSAALKGDLTPASVKAILATMRIQGNLPEVDTDNARLTSDSWQSVLDQYRMFSIPTDLTAEDWGRSIRMYGSDYTIAGFHFNAHTKRREGGGGYKVVLERDGKHFVSSMRNVAYALKHSPAAEIN